MAKSKKHAKKRRSSKMGAMLNPKSPIIKIAALAAGYLLADTINTKIDSMLPTSTPAGSTVPVVSDTMKTAVLAGELGLGGYLLLAGKPSLVKTAAGGILAGAGLKRGLKKFGVISGYQSVPVIAGRVRGYQSVPVIAGTPAQLAGQPAPFANTPDVLKGVPGYGVNGMMNNGYNTNGSGVLGSLYTNADNGSGIAHSNSALMES